MPPNSVAQGNARTQPDDADRMAVPEGAAAVEQTQMGTKDAPKLVTSFDGLGVGFEGPQGAFRGGNPSDNSLAVGPDHIVQIVNSRMAVYSKQGKKYDTTGKVLYGPVNTNNVFRGCDVCGDINNGDAVVRYDQLADRWLIVMPIFRRLPYREDQPEPGRAGEPAQLSQVTNKEQPGPAVALFQPPALTAEERAAEEDADAASRGQRRGRGGRGAGGGQRRGQGGPPGPYAMCYAISTGPDPLGTYYRYHFVRPLFPDYPRPAVWPDGYYVPTSTGDNRISPEIATQKHACVVEREAMLQGKPAREQCVVIENVNFLNNADVDGKVLPPPGAPNIMMAAGGTQLNGDLQDNGIYYWKFHVDWDDPAKTKVEGPVKIDVAPYAYLCGGQLTRCVTQPGTETTLDSQGDKIMQRLVYRRIGDRESILAVHSVNTSAGGGGVRWYEFRVDDPAGKRDVKLYQQGTYAPGGDFRWMASPAMDSRGNIGIGYSFGGVPHYPGQRFTGRLDGDPLGKMTLKEAVLAAGEASQARGNRWQDYTTSAVDPSDDCTIWYVGDYVKDGANGYSTKIGAFRMPGCAGGG